MGQWALGLTLTAYPTLGVDIYPLPQAVTTGGGAVTLDLDDIYNGGIDDPETVIELTNANLVSSFGFSPGSTYNTLTRVITLGDTTAGDYLGVIRVSNGPMVVDVQVPITVTGGTNTAPVIDNPRGDLIVTEDTITAYVFPVDYASDAEGGTLALAVTDIAGNPPPGFIIFTPLTRTLALSPTQADVDAGPVLLRARVSDSLGAFADEVFTVTVAEVDEAPTVENPISGIVVTPNTVVNFLVPADTIVDEEGATLTYTAYLYPGRVTLPDWIDFTPVPASFEFSPLSEHEGTWQIELVASDGLFSTSHVFNLYVSTGETVLRIRVRNDELVPVQKNVGWRVYDSEVNSALPVSVGDNLTDSNGELVIPFGSATGQVVYVLIYAHDGTWRDVVKAITQNQ